MKSSTVYLLRSYLLNAILFIGFSFEFFIRSQIAIGMAILFVGLVNLIQSQADSKRVKRIQMAVIFMDLLVSFFIADSYAIIDYITLYFLWLAVCVYFFLVLITQIRMRMAYKKHKKKIRDHFN